MPCYQHKCIMATSKGAYIHHGYIREAFSLFDALPIGDAYSWTVIIKGLANSDHGQSNRARNNTYYDNIKFEYMKNKVIFLFKLLNIVIFIS
ncbi:hypothetical protein AMTRI_Chr05g69790 [Amborella trichopoda]